MCERGPVAGPGGLLVDLEPGAGPLHEQLELSLREQVRSGRLAPGARLPSSRALAAELGVSRGVVLEAYSQLVAEGYLVASQGAPTRVAAGPRARARAAGRSVAASPATPTGSIPALPDLAAFPRDGWLRSLRAALRDGAVRRARPRRPARRAGAAQRADGLPRPRPRRGARARAHDRLRRLHAGVRAAVRRLRERGIERIAVEDPGWAQHRLIAERAGLEPVAIAVDERRARCRRARRVGLRDGRRHPGAPVPDRRRDVLRAPRGAAGLGRGRRRADRRGRLRLRAALRPRPASARSRAWRPSACATSARRASGWRPALRLGWMLSPSWLTGELTYAKGLADGGTPALEQLALADFIARGELDRHLRRMRLRYRRRRDARGDGAAPRRCPKPA